MQPSPLPHAEGGTAFAAVYLLDQPYAIDRAFDYRIPDLLREDIRRGSFVTVPFGAGNKTKIGLVTGIKDSTDAKNIKPIDDLLAGSMALDEEMTDLCLRLAETTLSTVGDAVRALPSRSAPSRSILPPFPGNPIPVPTKPSRQFTGLP